MITLDHIGIAVGSIEERTPLYEGVLGLAPRGPVEEIPGMRVRVRMFDAGGNRIELIEPASEDSPIAGFLLKRGEGIHHVAFGVDDIRATLAELTRRGFEPIDKEPRPGHGRSLVAFLNPKTTGGVLIELKELRQLKLVASILKEKIRPGSVVIVNLMNPREKFWGVLRSMDTMGVQILGIELGAVGDLIRQLSRSEEMSMALTSIFFPMSRVEKMILDETAGAVKAYHEAFTESCGVTLEQLLEDYGVLPEK